MVADAIARTEIPVRVVIEGAPADAASVLRIGSQLIVNASMTHGMLREALDLINRLGRVGVPDKFRI